MCPTIHLTKHVDTRLKKVQLDFAVAIKNGRTAAMLIMCNVNFPESTGNSYRRAIARKLALSLVTRDKWKVGLL